MASRILDAVVETVGGAENFNIATTIVRKQGAVVLVAGYYKPLFCRSQA